MAAGEEAGAREGAAAEAAAVVSAEVAEAGIRTMKELNRKKREIVSESELNDHVYLLESRAREYIS